MGNIKQITAVTSNYGTDTQTFNYDHLNRLITAVATGGAADYTHNTANTDYEYDKIGNITFFGSPANYVYTAWNGGCLNPPSLVTQPMPHAVKQIGSNYYCYDKNGNMNKRVENGVTYTQNFDVENRLTSVVSNGQTTAFAYDAAGMRVKTVKPNGTIIDHPFPNYEVENPTGTPIKRSSYSLAGQPIATRVSGDLVANNNGLFYIHSDHLGSSSVLTKYSDGYIVTNSLTWYQPFGGYRGTAPTQTITAREFGDIWLI